MKGLKGVEGELNKLVEGTVTTNIKCQKVNFTSSTEEKFIFIQLQVKQMKDIYESFDILTKVEDLTGENKYDAGIHGKQDAKKGIVF